MEPIIIFLHARNTQGFVLVCLFSCLLLNVLVFDQIVRNLEDVTSGDKRKQGVEQLIQNLELAVSEDLIVTVDLLSMAMPLSRMVSQVK